MNISASKLIANRVNALKSTGPRSAEGKVASSINARRHGLAASPTNELATDLRLESPEKEARALGFSPEDSRQLALTLLAARSVIDAKHAAYAPEPEPDPVAERIDEHRRLMRYEQRAVNQIRKATQIKK